METSIGNNDDGQLWSDLKRSDEVAFAKLYRRYVGVLYSYGRKIVRNDEIVEDAIQDLFIDLWQMRERLSDLESARFYLFRSLRRKIHREYIKKNLPSKDWLNTDERDLPVTDSLEEDLIAAEMAEMEKNNIQDLLRQLPARQSEAIMLYYYEDFSIRQVAEILVINEQSARNLIQRGINKLRRLAIFIMPFLLGWLFS